MSAAHRIISRSDYNQDTAWAALLIASARVAAVSSLTHDDSEIKAA
jgi:hypothetical protein